MNEELPPGFHFVDPPRSFREFLADNGEDHPDPDEPPASWVAWYLDARWDDGVDTYDVNDGPIEAEWPATT